METTSSNMDIFLSKIDEILDELKVVDDFRKYIISLDDSDLATEMMGKNTCEIDKKNLQKGMCGGKPNEDCVSCL
jgi:hypothetical protein